MNSAIIILIVLGLIGASKGSGNGGSGGNGGTPLMSGTIIWDCVKNCAVKNPFGSGCWVRDYDYKVTINGWRREDDPNHRSFGNLVPLKVVSGDYDYADPNKGLRDAEAKYETAGGIQCRWATSRTNCYLEDAKKDGYLDQVTEWFTGDIDFGDIGFPDMGSSGGGAVGR
jgi:hypothetical protein